MTADLLRVHRDDGARAALQGRPATDNPWKPDTVGGHAWALGWNCGRLMRPVARPLAFLASLWAVLRPKRGPTFVVLPEPCDLFDDDSREDETVCAACGVEWWRHETRCEFDEIASENENRFRASVGKSPIPRDVERCDGCGEKRSHRRHTGGPLP